MEKIFLLEDDINFGSVLKAYLEMNDFFVHWVNDGKKAVNEYITDNFDICILDVMLPNIDGFTIAKEIKIRNKEQPIIFLTAKGMKEDMLTGYKIGADDYITKPFDSELLLYKIKAILNRKVLPNKDVRKKFKFNIGKYTFNSQLRVLNFAEQKQRLSPKESDLLELLCRNQNSVLSREEALKKIWNDDNYFTTRSMDVYITKLRKYLKEDPNVKIDNIHGSGFILTIHNF